MPFTGAEVGPMSICSKTLNTNYTVIKFAVLKRVPTITLFPYPAYAKSRQAKSHAAPSHFMHQSCGDQICNLSRDVWTGTSLSGTAPNRLLNLIGAQSPSFDTRLCYCHAQVSRGPRSERSPEATYGRAYRCCQVDVSHWQFVNGVNMEFY